MPIRARLASLEALLHALLPKTVLTVALCLLPPAIAVDAARAQTPDQLLVNNGRRLSFVPLPDGAAEAEVLELTESVTQLTYLDDDRLMAVRPIRDASDNIVGNMLTRIESDGTVVDVGVLEPAEDAVLGEDPIDLAVDSEGRLFLLSRVHVGWNPPDGYKRLVRIDPEDGATLQSRPVDDGVETISHAPDGLWASKDSLLHRLDPESGSLTQQTRGGAPMSASGWGDTDSTGALWLITEGVCSPPCYFFRRLDPATGAVGNIGHPNLNPEHFSVADVAVKRNCMGSDTALCLQGGRFRAEVAWRDFEGDTGAGRLTAARSADSGVFWFFAPANWELMVKVLDGCGLGGHYWVFVSGSTSVEYTLTVTDLLTEESRIYENPLDRTALTVTDTSAFPCDP